MRERARKGEIIQENESTNKAKERVSTAVGEESERGGEASAKERERERE